MKPVPFRLVHSCWHSFSSQLRSWPKSGARQHRARSLTHLKQLLSGAKFKTYLLCFQGQNDTAINHYPVIFSAVNFHVTRYIPSNKIFLSTQSVMAPDKAAQHWKNYEGVEVKPKCTVDKMWENILWFMNLLIMTKRSYNNDIHIHIHYEKIISRCKTHHNCAIHTTEWEDLDS